MNKIDIWLEDRQLDVADIDLALTYNFSDLSNPLSITGDYSKTITIKGNKTNNEIFGQIWNFNRINVDSESSNIGVYFNPSKRVNCKIYIDGGIFKSGYIKLNDININKGVFEYNVTFYSELCNVLRGLKDKKIIDLPFKNNLKHTIYNTAINSFWNGEHTLSSDMTYIMANNGLYEDFNSSKMARYDGYNLVSVDVAGGLDFDECMKGEYRSYKQRPALQVKKLIDMIADENDITLDSGFFNENNPYYSTSVLTMPKLNSKEQNKEFIGVLDSSPYITFNVPNYSSEWTTTQNIPYKAQENSEVFTEDYQLSLGNLLGETDIVVEAQMKVKFIVNGSYPVGSEVLFSLSTQPTCTISFEIEDEVGRTYPMTPYSDKDSKLNFLNPGKAIIEETNGVTSSGYFIFANHFSKYMNWAKTIPAMPIHFYYPKSLFTSSINYTIMPTIKFNGANRKCTVSTNGMPDYNATINSVVIEMIPMNKVPENESYNANDYYPIDGINYTNGYTGKDLTINNTTSIKSEIVIDKTNIIDEELTVGDFLINYTKQFGLLYETDADGKITIKDRNTFFRDYQILDWEDKIDYNKNIKQTPITFENKNIELNYAETEAYYNKYYKNKFGIDYGVARIATGYEFNDETKIINEDNIFTNAIMSRERTNMLVGSSVVYKLDEKILPALFNMENNQRNNADVNYSLLFDNGKKELANSIVISDDPIPFDGYANVDENMWIDTSDTTMMSRSGKKRNTYRQYSTLTSDGKHSWKYGYPRENYANLDRTSFNESSTIYSNFWKSYISEIYNVDNKIVKCYVNLTPSDMTQFSFKNFVKAFGCLWHVNQINNYNPLKNTTTEVELIKVKNIESYVRGQVYFPFNVDVSYTLTNVTSSNSNTTTTYGEPYTTTLSFPNEKYYFSQFTSQSMGGRPISSTKPLSITMNGIDVTEDVFDYNTNTISIATVTGPISIYAVAYEILQTAPEDDLL